MKRAGLCLLVALSMIVALGMEQGPADKVRARRFEVLDDAGNVRAALGVLGVKSPGSGLLLLDKQGKPRVTLKAQDDDNSTLSFLDTKGKPRIILKTSTDGSVLITLADKTGRPRTILTSSKTDNPSLCLTGPKGEPRAFLYVDTSGKPILLYFDD